MRNSIFVVLIALVLCACAFAQGVAGLGAISGTVRDASGAVVPQATVVVSNESKGIRRTLQTTEAGAFSAPALVPSKGYSVSVNKTGFANWEAKDFEVLVGQTVDFRVSLQISAAATEVQVTAEAPLVEDTKSGVSQVVTQHQIEGLPINGRRADTFVLLTPAVVSDGTFGLVSFRGIASGNSFLTDGNDTTNSFYNENAGRTRISTQISQDAVQEFQVLSDGFSAEFGRAIGGVINTVTRSGSNDFHGAGYWYFRNRSLNAPDRYANHFNGPEWRHQAGGSLGGPIKSNKLFFFANFEMVKRNFPLLSRIINTSFTDTNGKIIPSKCTASAAQCAAAIAFIQAQQDVVVPRTVDSQMGFAKLDWRPTEKHSFSFDSNVMHWDSPHGIQTQAVLTSGNGLGGNGNSTVETRYGKASWTSLPTASSVNEMRFGWFKDRLSDPASSDLWPSTGGLVISLNNSAIGAAAAYPRTYPSEQRFQLVDNYSWIHGAHSMKFGVDYSTTEDYMNQLYNGLGTFNYANLTNFAKDFSGQTTGKNYSSFTQTFGNPIQDFRTSDINLYAQDTWKLSRSLTFNYGMRWEKSFLPQPTLVDPNYPQTGVIPSTNRDFAPRASLSYSINDKTVVRAGYGMFYARFLGNGLDTLFLGNGKYQTSISVQPTVVGAPSFPNIVPDVKNVPAGTANITFADKNFRNAYTQQGTLAIERQLTRDMGLTVSYIWSRGLQLWTSRDLNLGAPGATGTYIIQDENGNQTGTWTTPLWITGNKPDTRYGHIYQVENGGQSWYNGLAVQLRKNMSHGVSALVSYTWSHAIDDANQSGANGVIGWSQYNTFAGDYAADKGSSPLDQRHRAVVSFLWSPTLTHSQSFLARYLVNGWELSSITTMASAQPASATVTVSGQQFTGTKMLWTSTLNGTGGWNRVPFWPVSSLDVDQIYRVDARLSRTLPFSERVKAALMFEAFNLCNTQYNTDINKQAYAASGGILKPVSGLGVGNQSQGFPDGTNARRMQVAMRVTF